MATSENSQIRPTLTCSAAVSPAKTSASLANGRESQANEADSGLSSPDLYAKWDRDTSSWRMSQASLFMEESPECSATWPRAGTMRNGIVYQRESLVRISDVIESSSLPNVPCPVAADCKGAGRERLGRGANNNLRDWCAINYNLLYPPVALVEYLLGFPIGFTALEHWETPSSRKSSNGSGEESHDDAC